MDMATLRARAPLFLAVFIDIFSFGLMYPLLVALFENGSIVAGYAPATRDTLLSLAFALFPIGMFFGASLLGDLSDALGRKKTLMICMAGLAGSYALMWLALEIGHLWLFFLGRLSSGLMAGTAPIAQASVVDAAPEDQRSAAMAQVVLVNTLGMVAGPAIGGVLGHWDFRLPLGVALVLCLITLALLGRAHFARDEARRALSLDWKQPFLLLARVKDRPAIIVPALSFFLFQFGFLIYYTFILIEMQRSYGFTTAELGLFSMVMGIGCAFSSAIGFKFVRARLGSDKPTALLGLALCGMFLIVSGLPLPAWGRSRSGSLDLQQHPRLHHPARRHLLLGGCHRARLGSRHRQCRGGALGVPCRVDDRAAGVPAGGCFPHPGRRHRAQRHPAGAEAGGAGCRRRTGRRVALRRGRLK